MRKQPWLKMHKKTAPELPLEPPIMLGNRSNGEFFHEQTPRERKIRELILQKADENARYVGMDRRDFLASTMGMATSLAVLNMVDGCSANKDGTHGTGTFAGQSGGSAGSSGGSAAGASGGNAVGGMNGGGMSGGGSGGGSGSGSAGKMGGGNDGGFNIPPDAMVDPCTADHIFSTKDFFIMDLQTHFIEDEQTWKTRHPNGGAWQGDAWGASLNFDSTCGSANNMTAAECIGPARYVDKILLNSDTTVAVLSGFPTAMCSDGTLCTNLNSNDDMAWNRQRFNKAAGNTQRVVQHCQVAPNDQWDKTKAMMSYVRSTYGNHGWKCYPPWGPSGSGWWLDDALNSSAIAEPFFEHAKSLGEPLICAHKGFPLQGFDRTHTDPKDVGPAAVKHPEIKFVIYHSAFESGIAQGEYGTVLGTGNVLQSVDRLCKTVLDNKLKGKNVYAEMGSAWALVSNNPTQAQHYIGKLLKYIGEDNICWGSECMWFGSPQPQIEAFRVLTISPAFQQMYGYPELTDAIKAKIFGGNGARIYGIDPKEKRCTVDKGQLAQRKRDLDGEFGDRRWAFQEPEGPTSRREFMTLQKWRRFLGQPA